MQILSRMELTVSYADLSNYVCMTFAILGFSPEYILKIVFDSCATFMNVPGRYMQITLMQR